MSPLTVRFTEQQAQKLARLAELEDRSRGSVVRRLVDSLDDGPVVRAKTTKPSVLLDDDADAREER